MKLLVLGGTRFLGRHIAEQALAAGHELTLLHRGRSASGLFPQARHLIADRDGDLSLLAAGGWDAVIDTSAYFPRQVRSAGAVLRGRIGHYLLVSSVSVYSGFANAGTTEDAPLQVLADPTVETIDGSTYGGLKVLCEQAAREVFGDPAVLVARPGLIVGPHDPSERFTWWLRRLQRGGEMLVPAPADAPLQVIDARDLADWLLLQGERRQRGTFNVTGPSDGVLSFGAFFAEAAATLHSPAQPVWVDEAFLIEQGVQPWSDLPLWLPRKQAGLHQVDISRARAGGLRCRPLAQTVADTAAWARDTTPPAAASNPPGLPAPREVELLAAWRGR